MPFNRAKLNASFYRKPESRVRHQCFLVSTFMQLLLAVDAVLQPALAERLVNRPVPSATTSYATAVQQEQPTDASSARVDQLTVQILLQILALERFYTKWRILASHEPRWRHLRYFLTQEAGAGLFLGSQTTLLVDAARSMRNPDKSSERAAKLGTEAGLLGSIVEGESSGFELASNIQTAIKNKKLKQDPESARQAVFLRGQSIDALMRERDAAISTCSEAQLMPLFRKEGEVLRFFRDACLNEFADVYADVKSFQASYNVYYGFDVIGSSIYVASYVLGLKGFTSPGLFGSSNILGIVGDGVFIPSAPGSTFAYNKSLSARASLHGSADTYLPDIEF
jgi:hypothetical protein